MNHYSVEYTDTFGGEANYCWVKRATVAVPESTNFKTPKAYRAFLTREAKRAMGLTGVRGRIDQTGDGFEFRPYGMCTVLFVTWSA